MIKSLFLLCTLMLPITLIAAPPVTEKQLNGVWNFEGYPWPEKYEFKSNGTVNYIVKDKSRNYPYKLVKNEIIIQREHGQTINRLIVSFDGKTMKLKDTFLDKVFTLKKE